MKTLTSAMLCVVTFGLLTLVNNYGLAQTPPLTPVAYRFPAGPLLANDGAGAACAISDDLSMDCLAANGYGQWTSSYFTSNNLGDRGNFLLANTLRDPSCTGTYPTFIGTEVVGSRKFLYKTGEGYPIDDGTGALHHSNIKVACNLKGQVRYVWPSPDGNRFYIQGYNECANNAATGINLEFHSFPFENNPAVTGQDPLMAKEVIRTPNGTVRDTGSVEAQDVNNVYNPVLMDFSRASLEQDPRNTFDIAIDAKYLYITWVHEVYTGSYWAFQLYVTAVDLNTGVRAGGFGKLIGAGSRPSIAADVRRNPLLPTFDLVYRDGPVSGSHIWWVNYELGTLTNTELTTKLYNDPADTTNSFVYYQIHHLRVLVASCENVTPSANTARAIYFTAADENSKECLLMQRMYNGALDGYPYYADGVKRSHADPIGTGAFPLRDTYLRGFANPYDGNTHSFAPADVYDEFHCLYQLDRTYGTSGEHFPLMIIRGAFDPRIPGYTNIRTMSGPTYCLSGLPLGGTAPSGLTPTQRGTLTQQFYDDPAVNAGTTNFGGYDDNFVGAVNQMGIHIHWRNGTKHYYLRDKRDFDENVEENTLASEDTYVSDGSSSGWNHGGDYPPMLLAGKTLTMWVDPHSDIYRYHSSDAYEPSGVPSLNFRDPITSTRSNACDLYIGDGTSASKFVTLIQTKLLFSHSTQTVQIRPFSSLECYEHKPYAMYEDWSGGGTLKLVGTSVTYPSGNTTIPSGLTGAANLNLHGGTMFNMGAFNGGVGLNSFRSYINFLHDQDIRAGVSTSSMADPEEMAIFQGATMTESFITSANNSLTADPITFHFYTNGTDGSSGWTASNCVFVSMNGSTNFPSHVLIYDATAPFNKFGVTSITNGIFDGMRILYNYPTHNTTIDGTHFDHIFDYGVYFENAYTPSGGSVGAGQSAWAYQRVQNCDFATWSNASAYSNPCGIHADWFHHENSSHVQDNVTEHIFLDNNTFTHSNTAGSLYAAIWLENSDGMPTANTISDHGFKYGIVNVGNALPTPPKSTSLICSNTISNAFTAGILTNNYIGYAKLNDISNCPIGHSSGANDKFFLIFSNYHRNQGPGLDITDHSAYPSLTGVHNSSSSGPDDAAFNIIKDNATAQVRMADGAKIDLGVSAEMWSWTNFCQNRIEKGTSTSDLLIDGLGSSLVDISDISNNWWGVGIDPANSTVAGCGTSTFGTPSSWQTGGGATVAQGICYSAGISANAVPNVPSGVICESSLPPVFLGHDGTRQSMVSNGTTAPLTAPLTVCKHINALLVAYQAERNAQGEYDSAKWYLLNCYDKPESWRVIDDYYGAFVDAYALTNENILMAQSFLKSILYLNTTDPEWYCQCARHIANLMPDGNGNGSLAVIKYLIESGRCPKDTATWKQDYVDGRRYQHQVWVDTAGAKENMYSDTIDYPFDSTLPSLHSLGLDLLIDPHAGVQARSQNGTALFGNARVVENPFRRESSIELELPEAAYIRLDVVNVLGEIVFGEEAGRVYYPGPHTFAFSLGERPAGVYYARLSTPTGDTRTIKLVKK